MKRAPALRSGGYIIDLWGVGYDIAERMGLIPEILELGYQVGDVRFVDRAGELFISRAARDDIEIPNHGF